QKKCVRGCYKDFPIHDGNPSVPAGAPDASRHVLLDLRVVSPDHPPCCGVESKNMAPIVGDVHLAINHQRRDLEILVRSGLKGPLDDKALHVGSVDLLQGAKTGAVVTAVISEPIR